MNDNNIISKLDAIGWGDWILSQGDRAGYLQTNAWAQTNAILYNRDSFVVEMTSGQNRLAGALCILHRFEEKTRGSVLGDGTLNCHDGPVFDVGLAPERYYELVEKIVALGLKLRVREIVIKPGLGTPENENLAHNFAAYGFTTKSWLTSIVDLTQDEEVIFQRFRRSVRKSIRKCEASEIEVMICKSFEEQLADFILPYFETTPEKMPNVDRLRENWQSTQCNYYNYFIAKDKAGVVLAVLGTYHYNGMVTEIASHRTKASYGVNLPVQDLLHWEIMKFHKARGDQYFDLAGYSPDPQTPKEQGIRAFKEKWGGREINISTYTKDLSPLWFRIARKIKNLIRDSSKQK